MNPDLQLAHDDEELLRSFGFLLKAYDSSSEHADQSVPIWDIGSAMGLSESEAEAIACDLQERNLVYYSSLAGDIALTSFGMSEVVLAQSQPQLPTTHFPALASMSAQMMLPLSAASEPAVVKLVDQLESFREDLELEQGGRFDLAETMQLLDETLQRSALKKATHKRLIAELESICQELD